MNRKLRDLGTLLPPPGQERLLPLYGQVQAVIIGMHQRIDLVRDEGEGWRGGMKGKEEEGRM